MSGVYISWPFCPHKCSFCNFASGVFARSLEAEYADALLGELRAQPWPWAPDTIYFGGGTPAMMDTGHLRQILGTIPAAPWREVTIEALPGHVTAGHAIAWNDTGVNRVSFGVQSFVPAELDQTGRRHTPEDIEKDFATVRRHGIQNLSLDLIAGLPYQTVSTWSESLDWIAKLRPQHVSVYLLEVDDESRLGAEILNGGSRYGATAIPGDSLQAELYHIAVERLAALGFHQYEISNFAQSGFESIHNSKYWRREPYLGFGADAHSFDGVSRWCNVETPGEYVQAHRQGSPVKLAPIPSRPEEERFYLGLRMLHGIRPSAEDADLYRQEISKLLDLGLLERDEDTLKLSQRGVLLSNEVFQEFIRT